MLSLPVRLAPLVAFLLGACASPRSREPDLARLYRDAAQVQVRNPVVVIHGILGARLEQRSTGRVVWGAFTREAIDPESPEGARALALPLDVPAHPGTYDPERCDVVATGPLAKLEVGLLFQVFAVDVYRNLIHALGAGGYEDRVLLDPRSPRYADDHFTCHSFFYDWRRDLLENVQRFHGYLRATRAQIERTAHAKIDRLRGSSDASERAEADALAAWLARGFRFDVVAHSMGGLLARYYLRYGTSDLPPAHTPPVPTWAGAAEIDRLVLVGTPNLGSMEAFRNLVEGFDPAVFLPRYDPVLLGSMPAIYQLLPRARHGLVVDRTGDTLDVDLLDPEVWRRHGWGLAHPDADRVLRWLLPRVADPAARRERTLAYQSSCLERARAFHAALDLRPATPCPTRITLFASDTEPTLAKVRLVERDGRLVPRFDGDDLLLPGDGTVARYSLLADERQGRPFTPWLDSPVSFANVTLLADDHVGLTRNPLFTNNLLFELLERRPTPLDGSLGPR